MNEDRIQGEYGQTSTARDADNRGDYSRTESKSSMNQGSKAKPEQMKSKLKEAWSSLSDEDIALFTAGKEDQFFDRLEEKHGVDREEAEEKLASIKQSCGCASNKAA